MERKPAAIDTYWEFLGTISTVGTLNRELIVDDRFAVYGLDWEPEGDTHTGWRTRDWIWLLLR